MVIKPRISSISATGSKIHIMIDVDGQEFGPLLFQTADLLEGANTIDNAWLLGRYAVRQALVSCGGDPDQAQAALLNTEVTL